MNIDAEILNKILEKGINPFYYAFDRPYLKRVIVVNSDREIYIIIICIRGQHTTVHWLAGQVWPAGLAIFV